MQFTVLTSVADNMRLTYTPEGENTQILSDPLLFLPSSIESFTVDCEGSGILYWTGPDSTTNNVSFTVADDPHQYYLPGSSFSRLNFSSLLSASSRGLYTCMSNGEQNSVYITNGKLVVNSRDLAVVS